MAYEIEGTYFESCNCDIACPCGASNLTLPATNERCNVLLAFHVERGSVDGVDVGDTTVAVFADTPAQMSDGGWRVGVFLDDGTSEEQRNALLSVFSGQQGGRPAMLQPLIGEMLGVEVTPMEYREEGRQHSLRIGDAVDLAIEDFPGPEEGTKLTLTGSVHPVSSTLAMAQTTRSSIRAFGMDVDTTGKNGHSSPFAWRAS